MWRRSLACAKVFRSHYRGLFRTRLRFLSSSSALPPDSELSQSTSTLLDELRKGDRRALAKLITLVESTRSDHIAESSRLMAKISQDLKASSKVSKSFRIGFSGAPGVGKSTFIETFGQYLLKKRHRIAVLAVDPSSERTGGSILGDKTRMPYLSRDDNAYVRPSPSRGTLGGVAKNTSEAIVLCEEAGYDTIFVETVGVGQSETAVDGLVDLFVLIVPPAGGDELQGMKKGIVELADLIIVNKADGDLETVARMAQYEYMNAIKFINAKHECWRPRVLRASAITQYNIDSVWESMSNFRHAMIDSGGFEDRRAKQRVKALWTILDDLLKQRMQNDEVVSQSMPFFMAEVQRGVLTPSHAANKLLDIFLERLKAS